MQQLQGRSERHVICRQTTHRLRDEERQKSTDADNSECRHEGVPFRHGGRGAGGTAISSALHELSSRRADMMSNHARQPDNEIAAIIHATGPQQQCFRLYASVRTCSSARHSWRPHHPLTASDGCCWSMRKQQDEERW